MKKSSKVLVTLLCSSMLILTACHKEESKSSMASSTPKSSQTMKSEKSTNKSNTKSSSKMADKGKSTAKSETKTSQSQAGQAQPAQSTQSTASQAQTTQSSQAAASTDSSSAQSSTQSQANQTIKPLDISAIAAGDYSSLAGTWQNDEGDSITFGADGKTTDGNQFVEPPHTVTNQIRTGIRTIQGYGAAMFIIPGGVRFEDIGDPYEEGVHDLDESRDRLMIGQGVQMEFHPFYRVQ